MPTSNLQRYITSSLQVKLGSEAVQINIRPDWLTTDTGNRLEVDVYIENLNLAIEVQGNQHYIFTPHFHKTYDAFKKQLEYDRQKQELCKFNNVDLYEVTNRQEADEIIDMVTILLSISPSQPQVYIPNSMASQSPDDLARRTVGTYLKLKYTRNQIVKTLNRASDKKRARKIQKKLQEFDVINNWRSSHKQAQVLISNMMKTQPTRDFTTKIIDDSKYIYCPTCRENQKTEVCKVLYKGTTQYTYRCTTCFSPIGKFIKKREAGNNLNNLPICTNHPIERKSTKLYEIDPTQSDTPLTELVSELLDSL
jgi:hypothetical protein